MSRRLNEGVRDKGRILVPQGATLVGCLDEFGVLEYEQVFVQVSRPAMVPALLRQHAAGNVFYLWTPVDPNEPSAGYISIS